MIQELDNIAGTPLPQTPDNSIGQSIQEAAPDVPPVATDVPPVIVE